MSEKRVSKVLNSIKGFFTMKLPRFFKRTFKIIAQFFTVKVPKFFKDLPKNIVYFFKVKLPRFLESKAGRSFINSLVAIVIGLFIGFFVMLVTKPANAFDGFGRLVTGGFALGLQSFGTVLQDAAPLILTGLAFAFAAKTGLFNIGASGQFMVGGVAALYVANLVNLPYIIHFIVCVLAAVVGGGIWAAIAGILKALFNVSEVIATIMLNYIGMYLTVILVLNPKVYDGSITAIRLFHPTANTPGFGFSSMPNLDIAILIALGIAIFISFILNRTTLGYQLKAVGYSSEGSKYAGIPYKRNIVIAMFISGALAGLGAALAYLPVKPVYMRPITTLVPYGFDGMSVSLLASNSPIGIIFSGLFISYIKNGAKPMQFAGFDKEIGNIVISVIIYVAALSSFIGMLIQRRKEQRILKKSLENSEVNK